MVNTLEKEATLLKMAAGDKIFMVFLELPMTVLVVVDQLMELAVDWLEAVATQVAAHQTL